MTYTLSKAISIFTSLKETEYFWSWGKSKNKPIRIECDATTHSLSLCCAQQVVINNLIRLVRPLTFQKGV